MIYSYWSLSDTTDHSYGQHFIAQYLHDESTVPPRHNVALAHTSTIACSKKLTKSECGICFNHESSYMYHYWRHENSLLKWVQRPLLASFWSRVIARLQCCACTCIYEYMHTHIPLNWVITSLTVKVPDEVLADKVFWTCLLVVKAYITRGFSLYVDTIHTLQSIYMVYIRAETNITNIRIRID